MWRCSLPVRGEKLLKKIGLGQALKHRAMLSKSALGRVGTHICAGSRRSKTPSIVPGGGRLNRRRQNSCAAGRNTPVRPWLIVYHQLSAGIGDGSAATIAAFNSASRSLCSSQRQNQ